MPPGPPWPGAANLVSADGDHACALTLSGAVYCWGAHPVGEDLSFGGTLSAAAFSDLCAAGTLTASSYPCIAKLPVPITGGGVTFTDFEIAQGSNCGLSASGTAYCIGDTQNYTVLPADTVRDATRGLLCGGTPCGILPLPLEGSYTVKQLGMSDFFRCILTTAGAALCVGDNQYGELGNAAPLTNSSTFLTVSGGLTFTSLVTSHQQEWACGLVSGGSAYCWGYNNNGGLGIGSADINRHPAPALVLGGHHFTALTLGFLDACGLGTDSLAYCWGQNSAGAMGNGTVSAAVTSPVLGGGGKKYVQLTAGNGHVCGLIPGGQAFCWGDNSFGQLGDNQASGTQSTSPVAVAGGLTFRQISAGNSMTCGVTTTNVVYCWGLNQDAELGNGTISDHVSAPVRVGG